MQGKQKQKQFQQKTPEQQQWLQSQPPKRSIPNIIHFVWIGGNLPEERLNNIKQWKENHRGYAIWVWSDSSWQDPQGKIKNGYRIMKLKLEDFGAELKDISGDARFYTEHYKKEAGLIKRANNDPNYSWTNFGTSSDLLRYYILYAYGGIYADSDLAYKVIKGETNSTTVTDKSLDLIALNSKINKHRNERSGNPIQLFLHQRDSNSISRLTNDLIVSPHKNDVLQYIIEHAHTNLNNLYNDKKRLENYPDTSGQLYSSRSLETQRTTGPEAVRQYVENYYKEKSGQRIPWVSIALHFAALDLTGIGAGSGQTWLQNQVPKLKDETNTQKTTAKSLAYSSVFPYQEKQPIEYEAALEDVPILLNGMKVIFDQPVGVYPVTLELKGKEYSNGTRK
jgi:hypothetical protein